MSEQADLPTLADQYKAERDELEETIAHAIIDFSERTGFVVKEVKPFLHDYRSSGQEPYYSVRVIVDL